MSTELSQILRKFVKFLGPGIMVSVAYMDPGNYSTSVSGGAQYKYQLLFSIFISNIFAVVLQCLCIKLGTVTGRDLAENCRRHLPRKLNLTLYIFAELAIIATDLAEVVGTAIALQILFGIPLVWGVVLTVMDVLIILMFYNTDGRNMKTVRAFEIFVSVLVCCTCLCFVLEMFKISVPNKLELFRGFFPTKVIFKEKQALYISLGILGATVMPHSLYLGSSIVKPRLTEYDQKKYGRVEARPSLSAIKYALHYSYAELIISLFLIATFVNSAILIVAGSTLSGQPEAADADLLSIYELLVHFISPAAGLIFALAMLCSGQSAGIICTMAGQIVSEGFLEWSLPPWATRLCTRLIAIVPCLIVTFTMGERGISDILNLSQVVLSLILPIVSAPLIYFTANRKLMTVTDEYSDFDDEADENTPLNMDHKKVTDFTNSPWLTWIAIAIWATIGSLNCYLVVSFLLGADVHF
ncbi:hypothetical protein KAFR_0F02620 [Kazachstania africana CBS 2517]|uniref:Iron transporter SMF3 n=1 Tax=Kazachstania africana (strain ATCC 22294 / BCRC 22015 / CBS 2517 / CECT 1963 / NBRC 1671 / NRRL Y-8276) TaxID=1071382 RepID=H2AWV9_KAZAF|nr:hypothetical protein KAFR_0F02620 [Kazachstania africana CBS 2517]CCF58859.1 hypothetical protein KAFR_0F02620 [Kazachstania africana CBS 2517]